VGGYGHSIGLRAAKERVGEKLSEKFMLQKDRDVGGCGDGMIIRCGGGIIICYIQEQL